MNDLDALIDRLAADTRAVAPRPVARRFAVALLAGCALTMLGVIAIGLRPDMASASASAMFWIKIAYGAALAATALAALALLARPEVPVPHRLALIIVPVACMLALATAEAVRLPPSDFRFAWLGSTWLVCPLLIAILAVPIAALLTLATRRFAPTRLRATGATIGLSAGSLSASLYALHCPESGASFVATWYSLGIVAVASIGYLAGPRLLRW